MHLLGIQLILLDAILFIYYALLAAPRRLWQIEPRQVASALKFSRHACLHRQQ